jgi:hypothetical protein
MTVSPPASLEEVLLEEARVPPPALAGVLDGALAWRVKFTGLTQTLGQL